MRSMTTLLVLTLFTTCIACGPGSNGPQGPGEDDMTDVVTDIPTDVFEDAAPDAGSSSSAPRTISRFSAT